MGVSRIINRRSAVLGLLLVILATAGFGFAATNSVQPSRAGDGQAAISGYNVTQIDYQLVAGDPTNIDSVTFQLAGGAVAPGDVEVKLVSTSTAFFDCTQPGTALPATYTCDITGVTVLAADEFRVVAAQ
ncbi:MAG TPA: hypothetical protein VEX37_10075 [Thermomicrobiales bacterium]|nr:hypothetical protein [Thermomicrobiales bacterium]